MAAVSLSAVIFYSCHAHGPPAGEAVPVPKSVGSGVSAGTVNVGGGTLHVVTTTAAGDSAVARMAALVEKVSREGGTMQTWESFAPPGVGC